MRFRIDRTKLPSLYYISVSRDRTKLPSLYYISVVYTAISIIAINMIVEVLNPLSSQIMGQCWFASNRNIQIVYTCTHVYL